MAGPWEKYESTEGPWQQYPPATVNPNLQAQGLAAEGRRAADFVSSRDPGIDYYSGIPSAQFRAGFSRMRNQAEKENYLNRIIGENRWGIDSYGAYYIKPDGMRKFRVSASKPVAIDEQRTTRYDVADLAGDAPAVVGATGAGLAASGLGTVPGLLLSGLGAAGGRAIDEIVKFQQDLQRQSPSEVAKDIGGEFLSGTFGESTARALGAVGRRILAPAGSRMTPEKQEMAQSAIEQGFKIRAGSVTDAPILARWEGMVRNIFGDLYADQNRRAAQTGIERLGAGATVGREEAGTAIANAVRKSRVQFGERMAESYARIDELVGNTPIIPTAPIKEVAQQILDVLPKTSGGAVVGGKDSLIRDILKMGDSVSVSTAQRLRTMLREAAEADNLLPDVSKHDARLLKNSVNDAFEAAKQGGIQNLPQDIAPRAIKALQDADKLYAEGIRRFESPVINAIAKGSGKPGGVDADMVVDYLVKPERIVRLRQVKSIVPEGDWAKVKSAHASELLSSVVKGTDDPLVSIFDGKALRDSLDRYGKSVLEEVHGREWVKSAYEYANALMLAEKKMKLSGGIVAANIALHPIQNLPKLLWLRGVAKVMENPGTFKYLTEGIKLSPTGDAAAKAVNRFANQVLAVAEDKTGSAAVSITPPENQ